MLETQQVRASLGFPIQTVLIWSSTLSPKRVRCETGEGEIVRGVTGPQWGSESEIAG